MSYQPAEPQPPHQSGYEAPPKRKPSAGLIVGVVVAVVAALAVGAGVALAFSSNTEDPAGAPAAGPLTGSPLVATEAVEETRKPGEPQTLEAARAAAQRGWDRFTAGDYGGTWDTYGAGIQKRISRADYAKVFKACNEALGNSEMFAIQVEDPRWFNTARTKVTVTVKHPMVTSTRTMVYEEGRWVQEPQPATLEVIATFKKSGQAEAVRKHCTN